MGKYNHHIAAFFCNNNNHARKEKRSEQKGEDVWRKEKKWGNGWQKILALL